MRKQYTLSFIIIVLVLFTSYLYIANSELFVDEKPHFKQVEDFSEGNFTLNPDLTTIPGFHYSAFWFSSAIGQLSPAILRFFVLILSIASISVFYLILQKLFKEVKIEKILQFSFLPLLFSFFFLIYTDVFSILLILLSLYFFIAKKYNLSGIFGILSILVRQNNIVWLGFMFFLAFYDQYRFKLNLKSIKKHLMKFWVSVVGFILFAIFVVVNKGFAIGDVDAHPPFSFHLGNVYFMLFLFFFLFLPHNVSNLKKILSLFKKKEFIVGTILLFILFLLTFINNHPYNIDWGDYFIRNRILIYFSSSILLKSLFFMPILYSILSLYVTKLHEKSYYLLYPFTILYLVPSWLIEQRYYIIPFVFFIIFKKEKSRIVEYISIGIFIILSLYSFFGIRNGLFFL